MHVVKGLENCSDCFLDILPFVAVAARAVFVLLVVLLISVGCLCL